MAPLETQFLEDCSPPVLRVEGEADLATAEQLGEALERAISVDPSVVVDMAGVTFIDATGLRVVLQAAESLNGSSPLTLLNARRVACLLDLVGLNDLSSIELREGSKTHG